jgi:hypothetical protein
MDRLAHIKCACCHQALAFSTGYPSFDSAIGLTHNQFRERSSQHSMALFFTESEASHDKGSCCVAPTSLHTSYRPPASRGLSTAQTSSGCNCLW